jgi:hypothetical protein
MTPEGVRLIPTLYQRGSKNGPEPLRWDAPKVSEIRKGARS